MTVLHLPALSWSEVVAVFARCQVAVPLARVRRPGPYPADQDRDELYPVIRPESAGVLSMDLPLRLHDPARPLPLPSADCGAPVTWLSAPRPDRALPRVSEVVAALAPLLAT